MPDSGWWKALTETRLSTLLLIWFAFAVLGALSLTRPAIVPEPFVHAHEWIELVALALSAIVIPWLLWAAFSAARKIKVLASWQTGRLRKGYAALDSRQRDLLDGVYRTGKNTFDRYNDVTETRWFGELVTKGWVASIPQCVLIAGTPDPYILTETAAKALEQIHGRV